MAKQIHIMIICGEPSGDLHAANLAKELFKINPSIIIQAVGGDQLRSSGAEIISEIRGFTVLGFFDVIKKLPRFLALQRNILDKIRTVKPAAVILVDFSGFNLRLAKKINNSVPVIYYIPPQVWASRPGRLNSIRKYISKLIVIFEFERDFYKKHGIEVDFAGGHPLLDTAKPTMPKKDFFEKFGLNQSELTIALLPGSRQQEIRQILPVMLEAAKIISKQIPRIQFIVAKSAQLDNSLYRNISKNFNLNLKVIEAMTYDCLQAADFCLITSGTATLEAAIMQKPFLIIYKMGILNYLLYRPQVKIPYIGIVNIISGKQIIPEFIQFNARGRSIAAGALKLLKNEFELKKMTADLTRFKSLLGKEGAALRSAGIITEFIAKDENKSDQNN
ncbi:MAG: lipid-A-disaccharide synthase [Candidatus Omnitrophica bacterium]|nr:lipid-A-disaccharide synthase [Candidatus Omnitrophota bacterium]